MIEQEIKIVLDSLGVPVAYNHFSHRVKLPYVVFRRTYEKILSADGKAYYRKPMVDIELYSKERNKKLENKLESLLESSDLFYEITSETYIESEGIYQIIYEI